MILKAIFLLNRWAFLRVFEIRIRITRKMCWPCFENTRESAAWISSALTPICKWTKPSTPSSSDNLFPGIFHVRRLLNISGVWRRQLFALLCERAQHFCARETINHYHWRSHKRILMHTHLDKLCAVTKTSFHTRTIHLCFSWLCCEPERLLCPKAYLYKNPNVSLVSNQFARLGRRATFCLSAFNVFSSLSLSLLFFSWLCFNLLSDTRRVGYVLIGKKAACHTNVSDTSGSQFWLHSVVNFFLPSRGHSLLIALFLISIKIYCRLIVFNRLIIKCRLVRRICFLGTLFMLRPDKPKNEMKMCARTEFVCTLWYVLEKASKGDILKTNWTHNQWLLSGHVDLSEKQSTIWPVIFSLLCSHL